MIIYEFITPLFLAIGWATLGCALVRLLWRSNYDWICAFWLLTVFGFTLFNRAIVLTYFVWPVNIMVSGLALLGPIIARFGYSAASTASPSEERWAAIVYGLFLLISSVVLTLTSRRIFSDMIELSNNSVGQSGFVIVTLALVSVGLFGLLIIFRSRKTFV